MDRYNKRALYMVPWQIKIKEERIHPSSEKIKRAVTPRITINVK
jgi:hypothetical protein